MSTALLVSIFLHYKRYGSFCIQSRLDEMVSAASHVMRFSSNSLGLIMVALLVAGTVTFVVYHYLLISWKLANTAWLTMEVISTLLAILSFSCNVALMVVNRYSPFDSLFRDIQLEGLVLTVGLVGALLHELFYLIGAVRLTNEESVASWAVAASVVKIVDSMAQTTLLLQTLRVFATFLTGKKFAVQQSFVIYLSFSNVAFALLNFIRQGEEIYGRIHLTAHGFLFWAVVRFIFSSFAILFRLFSSVSFASLWLRSFEG